jgi:hypothetical protein
MGGIVGPSRTHSRLAYIESLVWILVLVAVKEIRPEDIAVQARCCTIPCSAVDYLNSPVAR